MNFQDLADERETNHHWNAMLWAEEDLARRTKVSDSEIAQNKRNIDVFNQERNDSIRRMDQEVQRIFALSNVVLNPNGRLSSETPGQMLDRLSIMSLKIQAFVNLDMPERASAVIEQYDDLHDCLRRLLTGCIRGDERFKTYNAHKGYNSVETNPELMKELDASQAT